MDTNGPGRPRKHITPEQEVAWAPLLEKRGLAFNAAQAAYELETERLRATVREATLAGLHYRDIARLAGISLKMPYRIARRAGAPE